MSNDSLGDIFNIFFCVVRKNKKAAFSFHSVGFPRVSGGSLYVFENSRIQINSCKDAFHSWFPERDFEQGYKLKKQKFRLHIQKKFFILRVVVHWQRLPREAACAPSLAVSRAGLDRPVRLELDGLYGHFQLKPFYVSTILRSKNQSCDAQ